MTVDVVQFGRRPGPGMYSIERTFAEVRAALPSDVEVRLRTNDFPTKGVIPRLRDAWRVRQARGQVNHVLGDVHYLCWFLPRRGLVLTVHDCVTLERLRGWKRWVFWLLWYRIPVGRSERITVVSEFSKRELERWVKGAAARTVVVPPPCSPAFVRAPLPPRGARTRVLVIGTGWNKNLLRLFEAAVGLPIEFAIVGELSGEHRRALAEGGLVFEAFDALSDEEVLEQYRLCHLLAFPSVYEGFGMPIVEAQAIGRPVLTSNVCSMPEAAGGAACLVDPFEVASIRAGLLRLLGEPEYVQSLIERGYANAALYSPSVIAERYCTVYRAAAGDGP